MGESLSEAEANKCVNCESNSENVVEYGAGTSGRSLGRHNEYINWMQHMPNMQRKIAKMSSDLIEECKRCNEDYTLSKQLCEELESCSREVRREVVKQLRNGCAPLFLASRRGCVSIVEYLVTICDADIEQRGLFEVPEERTYHCVTPLWCAVVSGKLPVVRYLTHVGANINATSDSASTPVRSACFMTHIEIVEYLVEHGADIRKPNINGGTCLINSVQSTKLCLYLITKGADVNAKDIQDKTALHYAIQEHRLETTKLLLEHGANPFAKSRYGDDALRTACLKGAHTIFEYLTSTLSYEDERLAEAHELLGSTFLEDNNETRFAVLHWRKAHNIRQAHNPPLEKLPKVPLRAAYKNAQEFTTLQELDHIAGDVDAMRMQSLLICERILGISHKDLLYRLMFRGASYADSLQMQRCIDLWWLLLEVRVATSTVLHFDTSYAAQALVRFMLDVHGRNHVTQENVLENEEVEHENDEDDDLHVDEGAGLVEADDEGNPRRNRFAILLRVVAPPVPAINDDGIPKFEDVFGTFKLLADNMLKSIPLLKIRPVWRKQEENFDRIFKCLTHLIYLMNDLAITYEQKKTVYLAVKVLINADLRTTTTNDTLLHMCVSRLNVIKSGYITDVNQLTVTFPNASVIKLLIECGINVNAKNKDNSTSLHIASQPCNFNNDIVLLLLNKGADLDLCNKTNDRPNNLIAKNPCNTIPLMNFLNLKCLSATTICKYKISYNNQIPKFLEDFVKQHEP